MTGLYTHVGAGWGRKGVGGGVEGKTRVGFLLELARVLKIQAATCESLQHIGQSQA